MSTSALARKEFKVIRRQVFALAVTVVALTYLGTELPAAEPATTSTELLAVACKWNNCVAFYDAATGREVQKVEIGHRPHEMALSKDGTTAAVANYYARSITILERR